MGTIDIWSLITGVIGILSFVLALWDKFPKWKSYLFVFGSFLAGVAFGRAIPVINQSLNSITSDAQVASSALILIILIAVSLIFFILMLKKNQEGLAYMGIIFLLVCATPSVLEAYSKYSFKLSPSDYLVLSNAYMQKHDVDNTIKFLEKYLELTKEEDEKEQIKKKISQLKKDRLSKLTESNN